MADRLTTALNSKDSLTPQDELYLIDKSRILSATTPDYRQFLREADYGDLDTCPHLGVAKGVLRYDQAVGDAAVRVGLSLKGNDGGHVVNINQPNGRQLVEALGGKLLTTGLMYRVFIPYIKELAQNGNAEAQATLNEMINIKAEWLEDLILNKTRLKIGNQERRLVLPDKDGRFDRADINEFGYPTAVKDQGEFRYWGADAAKNAVVRGGFAGLGLGLGGVPSFAGVVLGVRFAKIF